mmetsp:Transcript_19360/g.43143  ORF Transcript_19360/g.43143 Transcript_19360/m.43143 type:complete len:251 (+) Transcript_19360:351-1103(+)
MDFAIRIISSSLWFTSSSVFSKICICMVSKPRSSSASIAAGFLLGWFRKSNAWAPLPCFCPCSFIKYCFWVERKDMLSPWIFLAIDICMFLRTVRSSRGSEGSSDCLPNRFSTPSAWWNRPVISLVFASISRSCWDSSASKFTISLFECRAFSSRILDWIFETSSSACSIWSTHAGGRLFLGDFQALASCSNSTFSDCWLSVSFTFRLRFALAPLRNSTNFFVKFRHAMSELRTAQKTSRRELVVQERLS